jgi:hypothetical protein
MLRTAAAAFAPGSPIRRRVLIAAGWTVIAVGVVISPLPGPGGVPVILAGSVILLRNSAWARRSYVRWKKRKPHWFERVERWGLRRRRRPSAEDQPPGAPPASPGPR